MRIIFPSELRFNFPTDVAAFQQSKTSKVKFLTKCKKCVERLSNVTNSILSESSIFVSVIQIYDNTPGSSGSVVAQW